MTPGEMLRDISVVLAGCQSQSVNLGTAYGAWARLQRALVGFGYHGAEDYHTALSVALGQAGGQRRQTAGLIGHIRQEDTAAGAIPTHRANDPRGGAYRQHMDFT